MKSCKFSLSMSLTISMICSVVAAQQGASTQSSAPVPRLVNFTGKVTDTQGKAISGIAGVTFAIYKDQYEGVPLWIETQNVRADAKGNYTVQLGATKPDGLPLDLFSLGDARWLGVSVNGGQEQPRVLLLSVPYALKAADAETIGGLPPSAFVLAAPASVAVATLANANVAASSSSPPPASSNVTTTGGTVNALPLWTTATNIQSSVIAQTGTGATAKVGINTTKPASTLDVNGGGTVRGNLSLPATGAATATAGKNSQPETFTASVYNSAVGAAVPQNFRWQAEPVGNNTSRTAGTLNLLYAAGSNTPAETGLKLGSNGQITFPAGQTFPGTGPGTVKSVGLTAPASDFTVSGSPVTNSGTLGLKWNVAPTSTNTSNAIVKRDAAGNFSAGNMSTVTLTASNPAGFAIVGTTGAPSGAIEGVNTGTSAVSDGVDGVTSSAFAAGVAGINNGGGYGVYGAGGVGVFGTGGTGVFGQTTVCCSAAGQFVGGSFGSGASGVSATGGNGSPPGQGGDGVFTQGGAGGNGGAGVFGKGGNGIDAGGGVGGFFEGGVGPNLPGFGDAILAVQGDGHAAVFNDDVVVTGVLTSGTKDFKIDHPLDPANKYLVHASIESAEMLNLYTGNVITDSHGDATVQFPAWFEALNHDFRYQLTVIGQFAQAIVAREISNHSFAIRTDRPSIKVSWQVTGVRQDAFAKAHPLVVEEAKDARLRGFYLHPGLYGAPEEKQVEWARHPAMMQRMRELRPQRVRAAKAQQ